MLSSLSLLFNKIIDKLPGCFLNLLEILNGLFGQVRRRFMLRMQRELNICLKRNLIKYHTLFNQEKRE